MGYFFLNTNLSILRSYLVFSPYEKTMVSHVKVLNKSWNILLKATHYFEEVGAFAQENDLVPAEIGDLESIVEALFSNNRFVKEP